MGGGERYRECYRHSHTQHQTGHKLTTPTKTSPGLGGIPDTLWGGRGWTGFSCELLHMLVCVVCVVYCMVGVLCRVLHGGRSVTFTAWWEFCVMYCMVGTL